MRRVRIWDTTLRDGLQVPGVAVTLDDKIEMAMNIRDLGVDYMEIGYPAGFLHRHMKKPPPLPPLLEKMWILHGSPRMRRPIGKS